VPSETGFSPSCPPERRSYTRGVFSFFLLGVSV